MILPLPRTGPSRRCRLQLMTKIRLSSFSRPAREIAPRDSGSSHSPSPRKHQTFCLPGWMKPRCFQVLHEACLVDRLDRTQTHGYGRELPEVRHQPRVRVGRQALTVDFLAEVVHLVFGDAAFHECAGVNAWRGVALEVDQVAAVFVGRGLEEVVEADVIQGRTGSEAGDVTTQVRIFQVRTHYHGHRVPAYQRANAAFHEQVARHACFVGHAGWCCGKAW